MCRKCRRNKDRALGPRVIEAQMKHKRLGHFLSWKSRFMNNFTRKKLFCFFDRGPEVVSEFIFAKAVLVHLKIDDASGGMI